MNLPYRKLSWPVLSLIGVVACASAWADDKSIVDFYSKNNVTIAVGFSAGGDYDLYARLLARHLGRHIPGNPSVIVRNMPGAGSRVLANSLYKMGSQQDGTLIGLPNQAIATDQATGTKGVLFDARQFHWIGSPINDVNVTWSWYTSKAKTFDLAKQYEVLVATSGPGSITYLYPKIMNALLGTKFKLVSGYPGFREMDLATERGEVDGRGASGWATLQRQDRWVAEGKINVLVQIGLGKAPNLPNVPLLPELAKNDADRRVLQFISLTPAMGRPFFMPPKTPADRVAVIRTAFDKTMRDPAFLEEAKRSQLDISPISGELLQQLVEETLATPKTIIDIVNNALE